MNTPELDDMVPEPVDEQPILSFLCHPHSKEKAKKTIKSLVDTIEEEQAKKEILNLPVKALKGVPKNILVAATTEDKEVFHMNMKTGEVYYE